MAATMGKDGSVRISTSKITLVDSWSVNQTIDTVEITQYGDTFKARAHTLKDWGGSFTVTYDRSDTNQAALLDQFTTGAATDVAFRFYTSSNAYWSGNGLMNSLPIASNVNDKVSYTVNFQGNGSLDYTTGT